MIYMLYVFWHEQLYHHVIKKSGLLIQLSIYSWPEKLKVKQRNKKLKLCVIHIFILNNNAQCFKVFEYLIYSEC